ANLRFLGTALYLREPEEERFFFRVSGESSGNFANSDNAYLLNATSLATDEIILLRWKAPKVSRSFGDFSVNDVRYFSISLSNDSSFNYITYPDQDLYVASDGYINLVIAREDDEVVSRAEGLNYMVWDKRLGERAYILYRNMLTNDSFANGIRECPTIAGNYAAFLADSESYDAKNYMQEYAPSGRVMSKQAFLEDFGGIEVSY
ncbi:MAG: hypothetical protein AAF740_00825, partial [Bacteroidota bacterium]